MSTACHVASPTQVHTEITAGIVHQAWSPTVKLCLRHLELNEVLFEVQFVQDLRIFVWGTMLATFALWHATIDSAAPAKEHISNLPAE